MSGPDLPRCFRVHSADNVATLLDELPAAGEVRVLGGTSPETIHASGPAAAGHKLALRDLAAGEPVVKFGVRIGHATRGIRRGEWVHLHNLASDFDARSGTLDLHTGAATDTRYE